MKIKQLGDIIGHDRSPFLILEAGVNHQGSLRRALEMVDAAAEAGGDAIKFQSYKADKLASKHSPAYWDQSEEPAESQYELFQRYDGLDDEDYLRLADRCRDKGITFCSTPFDEHFVDVLDPVMKFFKVASADIDNFPLLEKIASKGKPVLLSTGASYLSEVDEAVRFLKDREIDDIALLHCVLEYPTSPEHANLRAIQHLDAAFPECMVGYSDHVKPDGNGECLLLAWMLGAEVIEKHFTLDKSLPGNDHYHAMDPEDVGKFRTQLQSAIQLMGAKKKTVGLFEQKARKEARRSLVAAKDISEGVVMRDDMITVKRPGTGIRPAWREVVVGMVTKKHLQQDSILSWKDVETR